MKVLFAYLTMEYRGGAKFQVDFAKEFKYTGVGFMTSNSFVKYQKEVEKIGKIHVIPPTKKFFRRLASLKDLAKEYDVVYINRATLNFLELILLKLAGFKKIIYHSHSTGKDCENKIVKVMYYAMHYLTRPFIGFVADKKYACSIEAGKWLFGRSFLHGGKVINNGIDAIHFRFNKRRREEVRKKLNIKGICIMHAGAFSAVKNQPYLIRAFSFFLRKYPDSILMFAGHGELMEQSKAEVSQLGIENNVLFLGQRKDIPDLMQAADVFVLPSLIEGLPFVAIEAQAAGLPCIITSTASKDVKIIDSCEMYDVKKPEMELAKCIENKIKEIRYDTVDIIKNAGFDLKTCAKELELELNELFMKKM